MTQIRVKTIVVDNKLATLYMEDGSTMNLNQGDPKLARVIEIALPIIKRGEIAVIDLEAEEPASTIFADFEKKSNGFIRFFKAAKSAVKSFFGVGEDDYSNKPVEDKKPVMAVMPTVFEESAKPPQQVDKGMYAPIDDPKEEPKEVEAAPHMMVKPTVDDSISDNETIVAVLPNGAAVPGIENLKAHLNYANDTDQIQGMNKLIERLSVMINKRAHSVEDLLTFMKKGDMPVTINGDIIAYKVLNHWQGNRTSGIYVDVHSGKVKQRVGSFVNVREDLVDKNRRNECSNGLHVARHGYLYAGSFSADKCFMILVAPEDVVTVPHRDANKVRTMGYHIVAQLPDEAYNLIKQRRPITELPEMKSLLAEVIKGNHVPRLESVQINGQKGADLKITPLGSREDRIKWKFEASASEEEVTKAAAVTQVEETAKKIELDESKKVDISALNKEIAAPVKEESFRDKALRAIGTKNAELALELLNQKKRAKKGWSSYTVSDFDGKELTKLAESANAPTITSVPEGENTPVEPEQQIADKAPQEPEVKQDAVKEYDTSAMSAEVAEWFLAGNWEAIKAKKQKLKKSYTAMGFGPRELKLLTDELEKLLNPEPVKEEPKTEEAAPVSAPVVDSQKADEFFPIATMEEFRTVLERFILKPNQKDYTRLVQFKKAKKKSWSALTDNPAYNKVIDDFANGK